MATYALMSFMLMFCILHRLRHVDPAIKAFLFTTAPVIVLILAIGLAYLMLRRAMTEIGGIIFPD